MEKNKYWPLHPKVGAVMDVNSIVNSIVLWNVSKTTRLQEVKDEIISMKECSDYQDFYNEAIQELLRLNVKKQPLILEVLAFNLDAFLVNKTLVQYHETWQG